MQAPAEGLTTGPTQRVSIQTGAWYGDRAEELHFPESWEVTVHRPLTPSPLSDEQIAASLDSPVAQPPISQLAAGKSRPLIIVDDLTRPTPAGRIIPFVLRQLSKAGLGPADVSILLAQGTHSQRTADGLLRKVGEEIARECRLLVHDHRRDLINIGRTTFGTPVHVNRKVLESDLLIGIGGVYPQHSTGFGGGSKLALGVLGRRSIVRLHYGRPSMDGSYETDNDFRKDLDEIAAMIGLRTMITVHLDGERRIVRAVSGDHFEFYPAAVAFSRQAYAAPLPGDAEVVVSNAYPIDVSLTFMRSKGLTPLHYAAPHASRVVVAACSEGIGYHGLYPFLNGPRLDPVLQRARRVSARPPAALAVEFAASARRVARRWVSGFSPPPRAGVIRRPSGPIHLYAPHGRAPGLPPEIPIWTGKRDRMTVTSNWTEVLERLHEEQGGQPNLRVVVYACAPIQVIERPRVGGG